MARLCLRHRLSSRAPTLPSSYAKPTTRPHHLTFDKPTLDLSCNIRMCEKSKLSHKTSISCRTKPPETKNRNGDDNDGSNKSQTSRMAVGTVVIACCCILWMVGSNPMVSCPSAVAADVQKTVVNVGARKRKGKRVVERGVSTRSAKLLKFQSGSQAKERMLLLERARLNPDLLATAEDEFQCLLRSENPRPAELQKVAVKLEMSGKEDKAVAMLAAATPVAMNKGSELVHNLEMILVEMLIYQGNYEEAKLLLQSINIHSVHISGPDDDGPTDGLVDDGPTDVRFPLYMAAIHIMQGQEKEANECWKKFEKMHDEEDSSLTYCNFESTIRLLKQEIDVVRRSKSF